MEVNQNVKTKRGVLSQTARVFDPLSFCAIRTKILLRELWSQKLHWDDVIPTQLQELWTSLARDLVGLSDLKFPKQAINQDSSLDLCIFLWCITKCIRICGLRSEERDVAIHIFVMHHQMHTDLWFTEWRTRCCNSYFCDASPNAYGFVVYGVKNEMSQFIFLWCITKCIRICGLRTEERDVAIHIFVMHHQMHTDLWFTEWRTRCCNSYFCDASPNAYGFVVYGVKNEMSQFIFLWCITKCIRICGLRSEERNDTIHNFICGLRSEERDVAIHIAV